MKFFIFLICLSFVQLLNAQVTPAEKTALLAFYNATDGPNWVSENDADMTNDWDFTGPVTDDWFGLTIFGGNVVSINMNPLDLTLGGNNLTGTLPEEIKDLFFLSSINLPAENLSGNLPNGLFDINTLQILNLRSNDLTGPISDVISQLTNLNTLKLFDNEFNGPIPVALTTLNNLQVIELSGNNLSGDIPIELTDMIQLRVLKLGNNPITGFLYPEYGKLVNLETFFIFGNLMTGPIPPELGDMASLKFLWLGRNGLNGTLPIGLSNLTNLQQMFISFTDITGSIPEEYGDLTNLQSMVLHSNELSGALPSSLSNLTELRTFQVFDNQFSGELPESFGQWSLLERFQAGNNLLSGPIPESYANLTNLTNFETNNNMLSGELSPLFSSWDKITFLLLANNNLTGPIPESFSNLTSLEFFNVGNNQFSGILSPSFSNWLSAKSLDFRNNQFEGRFPDFTAVLSGDLTGSNGESLEINGNRFQFGDFEDEFDYYDQVLFSFFYEPQAMVNEIESLSNCSGSSITLSTVVSGTANIYQWLKGGIPISGANSADLIIDPLDTTDTGIYTCTITSTIVTGLTLERHPITLTVNEDGPTASPIADILSCDPDEDGFAAFNINTADIELQATGSQNGLIVSYFDATGNSLLLVDAYENTIANVETITVRVSDSGGCFNETTFDLITVNTAVADILSNVNACSSYVLPELNSGNTYFTDSDAQGSELSAGDAITNSQTIYIYAGTFDCNNESSFIVNIDDEFCDESNSTCEIVFPKFFSPDANGINDFFTAMENSCSNDGQLSIFNRYGQLLFQTNTLNNSWNGDFNGKPLPSSDYWYRFVGDDNAQTISGHFSLKR